MMLISILNWNGLDDTLACLERLGDLPPDFRVLVLDNGSAVDPRPAIAARFPAVELVREPVNLGFTGGHNAVMQRALERGIDSVLLLNNDCLIDLAAIQAMRAMLAGDDRIGAVSPLIYTDEAERRPQMVGGWIDWAARTSVHPSLPGQPEPAGLPTHVLGTALLLRCAALRAIGLLDDRFFAYYEDNDLSVRLAAGGWLARYCPSAIALHRHRRLASFSATTLFLSARNVFLFWRLHTPAAQRAGLTRALVAQQLLVVAGLQAGGAGIDRQLAVVDGCWAGLRARSGPPVIQPAPALLRRLALAAPYFLGQLLVDPLPTLARRFGRGKAAAAP